MRKIVLVGCGILALAGVASISACADNQQPYNDVAYQQQAPVAPAYAQQQGGFLDRHGDAILAVGVGYLAGKAASRPSYGYRPTTVINRTYVTPSRSYYSRPSYSSSFRSSSFGSFRSRRR